LVILKFIHLLSIVIWIGALVFFSFLAAPSIFKVLPRETAGEVVGHIFPKYWITGYMASILALATLVIISFQQKGLPTARIGILVVMTLVTFYSGLVVGSKARAIKAEIKGTEEPSKKTELREKFKKVHAVSSVLNLVVIILGLVLVFLTSRVMIL
jgi:uncharacterized membrane protein